MCLQVLGSEGNLFYSVTCNKITKAENVAVLILLFPITELCAVWRVSFIKLADELIIWSYIYQEINSVLLRRTVNSLKDAASLFPYNLILSLPSFAPCSSNTVLMTVLL